VFMGRCQILVRVIAKATVTVIKTFRFNQMMIVDGANEVMSDNSAFVSTIIQQVPLVVLKKINGTKSA
jgi:hypothetical protein